MSAWAAVVAALVADGSAWSIAAQLTWPAARTHRHSLSDVAAADAARVRELAARGLSPAVIAAEADVPRHVVSEILTRGDLR